MVYTSLTSDVHLLAEVVSTMVGVGGQHNSVRGYMPGVDYWQEDWAVVEGNLLHHMTGPSCLANSRQAEGLEVEEL